MSFEEAKQYLRREDENGNSLYEHLSRVLLKIIVDKPENVNAVFEHLSQQVREQSNGAAPPAPPAEGEVEVARPEQAAQLAWCDRALKLYAEPGGEDGTYPDLMTEAAVYEWAGISFGRTETYRLYLSIKAKALKEGLKLRFWGKVLGRSGDYLIAQAENPEPPPRDKKMEGAEGANKYAFWACKYAGADWVKLPDTTPEAIVVARQIKRFFTGDLDAPVPSYPPFPGGTEAHLLRAQIAQITAECSVSPDGFYAEDEEAEEGAKAIKKVEVEEGFEFKSTEDLKAPEAWKHHELPINLNGRCNQPPASEDEDEAAGATGDDAAEELPDMPLLAPIADDALAGGAEGEDKPAWSLAVCPGGVGESPDSVVVAKSLKWPGAVAASFGNKFVNVYCGFGFAASRGKPYEPPRVQTIQKEWAPAEDDEKGLVEDDDKITAPVVEAEEGEED